MHKGHFFDSDQHTCSTKFIFYIKKYRPSYIKKGLKFFPTGSSGFVDVRDVSAAMIQLMDKNIFSERFIINSENISYREVINLIADGYGMARPVYRAGKFLGEIAWRVEAVRKKFTHSTPMITKETVRNGQHHWHYSNEKIKIALDFEFIPIKDSILDTCRLLGADEKKNTQHSRAHYSK